MVTVHLTLSDDAEVTTEGKRQIIKAKFYSSDAVLGWVCAEVDGEMKDGYHLCVSQRGAIKAVKYQ